MALEIVPLSILFKMLLFLLPSIGPAPAPASLAYASISTRAPLSLSSTEKCERLRTSLVYSQENAPQDISAVLPLIVERVNRELSGVVDVEVLFTGSEIHRRVGKHTVQCLVTRLLYSADANGRADGAGKPAASSASASSTSTSVESNENTEGASELENDNFKFQTRGVDEDGRDVVTQCFLVPFTILDVDECKLPLGHSMRHECIEPAICVNTLGSYECLCPSSMSSDENNTSNDTVNIELASSEKEEIVTQFWNQITQSETSTRTPWEKSLPSSKKSSCPSRASTHGCCDVNGHSLDGSSCRSQFRCPTDPCVNTVESESGRDSNSISSSRSRSRSRTQKNSSSNDSGHDCVSTASCIRAATPIDVPSYTCECPPGFMGSGHNCRPGIDVIPPRPKVKFDSVTPTDETVQNNFYCGCTKPIVDPCAGYHECTGKNQVCAVKDGIGGEGEPHCVCKAGYVHVDSFGCVDESPPTLKLRHDENNDGITYLKQGDKYKEFAVDVIDENAEDYKRSLKIAYSRPLPEGCETKIGSFQVNYTVAMPWTNPPYARVTRTVVIEDIDECAIDVAKYETCPHIIPHCDIDHGAVCVNTIGSYSCKCPKYTTGDGFKFISSVKTDTMGNFIDAPEGYNGGTGCIDTSQPVIKVLGPNPKIFRTPKCGGLSGNMNVTKKKNDNEKDKKLVSIQREGYEDDIRNMIQASSGAELCATNTRTNPRPVDCVRATDYTYLGNVDLSSRVTVGNPVQVYPLEWKVPYNVMDEAGNAATTVWRQVIVEEVDLFKMEEKIRIDVLADKDFEIKEAVRVALEEERAKQRKKDTTRPRESNSITQKSCTACPVCDCKKKSNDLTAAQCLQQCDKKIEKMNMTCQDPTETKQNSTTIQILLERLMSFSDTVMPTFILAAVVIFVISVQFVRSVNNFLSRRCGWYYLNEDGGREEQEMLDRVTYFSPEGRPRQGGNVHTPSMTNRISPMPNIGGPPRVSMAFTAGSQINGGNGNGIFTTPDNRNGYEGGNGTPANGSNTRRTPASKTPYNLRRSY